MTDKSDVRGKKPCTGTKTEDMEVTTEHQLIAEFDPYTPEQHFVVAHHQDQESMLGSDRLIPQKDLILTRKQP